LISWNVAGLSQTAHRIHDAYGIRNNDKKIKKTSNQTASAALAHYLERMGHPDIVCLQEHKIPKSQLSNRLEPRGCSQIEGYESFWSCNLSTTTSTANNDNSSSTSKKGMNGVVTYAKRGTVLAANAFPLGKTSLDEQGRCVMTDHGKFVVFNVYVPASGRNPVEQKMEFLQKLRRAMQTQRQDHGKAVMLVGDLNISHGPLDVFWKHRVLHVNDVLQQVAAARQQQQQPQSSNSETTTLSQWKRELAQAWPIILETMKTRKVCPTQTTNSLTGATYNKFRLFVTVENPTRTIYLGRHEASEEDCYYGYDFDIATHYRDPETDELLPECEANVINIGILAELMAKIAKIEWNDETLREIANDSDAGRARIHPPRQWLNTLLEEDNMVDVFRYLYPTAQARFTCWCQYTNTRFSNNGTRIDYTIVDRCLLPFVQRGSPLRTGESYITTSSTTPAAAASSLGTTTAANGQHKEATDNRHPNTAQNKNSNTVDPLSEEAALMAATARGQFQPVSFEGGGIVEAPQTALDKQFGPRHTGMIYTPPSFSDHIAVSLYLGENPAADDDSPTTTTAATSWKCDKWGNLTLLEKDLDTKRAQPHKAQASIATFFRNNTNNEQTTCSTLKQKKPLLPQKRPATGTTGGVRAFFPVAATAKDLPSNTNNNNSQNSALTTNHNINSTTIKNTIKDRKSIQTKTTTAIKNKKKYTGFRIGRN
jgi:exonuclease III